MAKLSLHARTPKTFMSHLSTRVILIHYFCSFFTIIYKPCIFQRYNLTVRRLIQKTFMSQYNMLAIKGLVFDILLLHPIYTQNSLYDLSYSVSRKPLRLLIYQSNYRQK